MLQGFKGKKLNEVKKIIEQDLSFRRSQQKDRTKEKDEEDKIIDKKNLLPVSREFQFDDLIH